MASIAERLMQNPVFSRVYTGVWRPVFTRGFSLGGTETLEYDRALRAYLGRTGDRQVLDVACGPGNYAVDAARGLTGDGRYIGLDFATSMLREASRGLAGEERISFVRGDAHQLPFPSGSFDTVACLAALYLIPDPLDVLDEMARVTAPGGEVIVFTSVRASIAQLPGADLVAGVSGLKIFDRHEIVNRLHSLGLEHVEQTITGVGQYVHARKPR